MKINKSKILILGTIVVAAGALVGLYLNEYIPSAKAALASIILFQGMLYYSIFKDKG